MKEIKYFITLYALLLSCIIACAQDYYTEDRIKGSRYEYVLDKKSSSMIYIDNINNSLINSPAYVNGEEYPMDMVFLSQFIHLKDEAVFNRLINDFFTENEWNNILNEEKRLFFTPYFALSLDGDALEIKYGMTNHPIFRKIDPARLYELEKKLIKEITFYFDRPNVPYFVKDLKEHNVPSMTYGFNTKPIKEFYIPK